MKIALPRYINTLPFTYPIEKKFISSSIEFLKETPVKVNLSLQEKKVDVALVSSFFFLKNRYTFEKAFPLCIAAEKEVHSVLFFQKKLSLSSKKQLIFGITEESATSVILLRVISRDIWHIEPSFVPFSSKTSLEELVNQLDGFLLIGDRALQTAQIEGCIVHDLSFLWNQMTKLPFVFALFAKHKGGKIPPECEEELRNALSWSQEHPEEIEKEAALLTKLSQETLKTYFRDLTYVMTEFHEASLSLFEELL